MSAVADDTHCRAAARLGARAGRRALDRPALHRAGRGAGLVFFVMPLGMTAWMSLHNWPLMGAHSFIGLDNYFAIAARHPLLERAAASPPTTRWSSPSRSSPSPSRWRCSSSSRGR